MSFPTPVQVRGQAERIIATFRIAGVTGMNLDLLTRRNRLRAAIRAVVSNALDNDALNRLLLRADIPWTFVALVRAYLNYARQIGLPFTSSTVQDALEHHASVLRALMELFRVKFDPSIDGIDPQEVDEKRQSLIERTRRALLSLLDGIDDLTSDQVLRVCTIWLKRRFVLIFMRATP
ncbi:MAG: NAD-glutamate dehydrogenase [Myxococcota bacterium]